MTPRSVEANSRCVVTAALDVLMASDAAGGLGDGPAVNECHRPAELLGAHVVEKDGVDVEAQRLRELLERIEGRGGYA
jgi:hypothetical protein